jgi:hypothetical protein
VNRQLFSEIPNAAFLPFAAEGSLPAPVSRFQVDMDPSGAKSAPFGISENPRLRLRAMTAWGGATAFRVSDHLTLEAAR